MFNVCFEFLSDLIIEKVHSISTIYTEKNTKAKRQNRPMWALVIKYEGETHYTSAKKTYISNIHNIILLPKGSHYNWHCTKSGHFTIVEFECKKTCSDIFLFHVKNGEHCHNILQKMETNRTLKKNAYMLEELKDLYGLLSFLLKTESHTYIPSGKKQKIIPAIEYIAENYNKHISNDALAAVTGLSTVYFRKLFKEITGLSPICYVKSVKMKKAQKMLQSDYSNISDIAYSLGYNNIYEFSRDFKKYMGISPLNYAKQHQV